VNSGAPEGLAVPFNSENRGINITYFRGTQRSRKNNLSQKEIPYKIKIP
jgi:hypothetical protein